MLLPAINKARTHLDQAPLSLSDSPDSLPDWHAVIGMLLTAQGEWRKPRGVNANSASRPKAIIKSSLHRFWRRCALTSLLLEALIEIRQLPATTRVGDAWQLIVLISLYCQCSRRTCCWSFNAVGRWTTPTLRWRRLKHWARMRCQRHWRNGWITKSSTFSSTSSRYLFFASSALGAAHARLA